MKRKNRKSPQEGYHIKLKNSDGGKDKLGFYFSSFSYFIGGLTNIFLWLLVAGYYLILHELFTALGGTPATNELLIPLSLAGLGFIIGLLSMIGAAFYLFRIHFYYCFAVGILNSTMLITLFFANLGIVDPNKIVYIGSYLAIITISQIYAVYFSCSHKKEFEL